MTPNLFRGEFENLVDLGIYWRRIFHISFASMTWIVLCKVALKSLRVALDAQQGRGPAVYNNIRTR